MSSTLRFRVLNRSDALPRKAGPYFVLRTDNWDDFGHRVQFHLSHVASDGREKRIGTLKVLQRTSDEGAPTVVAADTVLPSVFPELDDSYVSLGQEDNFYKKLYETLGTRAGEVLDALRDIAWRPAFASDFEPTPAFRNAMSGRTAHSGHAVSVEPGHWATRSLKGQRSTILARSKAPTTRSKAPSRSAPMIRYLAASWE